MKRFTQTILLVAITFAPIFSYSQNTFIIYLKNKGNQEVHNQLISSKTLLKRKMHGLEVDAYDLPVYTNYLEVLATKGKVLQTSKWLNAVLWETSLGENEVRNLALPFHKITPVRKGKLSTFSKFEVDVSNNVATSPLAINQRSSIDYGQAQFQNEYMGIEYLHDQGYLGSGITMAFLDVGYTDMDIMPMVSHLFTGNKVIDTYDFWGQSVNVYHKGAHGRGVSFIVIGKDSNNYIGMAPEVNVHFYITDDLFTETKQDEFYFVAALERADSIGVDIVNASLGYKFFDNPADNYAYSDMDGSTAISTLGCNIAAQKGLLLVNAGGNSGTINVPADAFGVLSVGGADQLKDFDYISSEGPTFDQRICPSVAALTEYTMSTYNDPYIITGNAYMGTSSATPMVSGLAACLMEKYPMHSASQIIEAIQQSGHQVNNPDNRLGYGVPDAQKADSILGGVTSITEFNSTNEVNLFPNPSKNRFNVTSETPIDRIEIYSSTGQIIKTIFGAGELHLPVIIQQKGMYLVKILNQENISSIHQMIIY